MSQEQFLYKKLSRKNLLKTAGGAAIGLLALKHLGCSESGVDNQLSLEGLTPIPPEQIEQLVGDFQVSVFELFLEGQKHQFNQVLKSYNQQNGENITSDEFSKLSREEQERLIEKFAAVQIKPEGWKFYTEFRSPLLVDTLSEKSSEYVFAIYNEVRVGKLPMTITLSGFYRPEELQETNSFELLMAVTTDARLDYKYLEDIDKYEIKSKTSKNSKTFFHGGTFVVEQSNLDDPMPQDPPEDGFVSRWLFRQLGKYALDIETLGFTVLSDKAVRVTQGTDYKKSRPISLQEINSIIVELKQAREILERETKS